MNDNFQRDLVAVQDELLRKEYERQKFEDWKSSRK